MKDKYLYGVLAMNKTITVSIGDYQEKVKMSYADGMIGTMPIFDNKLDAEVYAGNKYSIVKLSLVDVEEVEDYNEQTKLLTSKIKGE